MCLLKNLQRALTCTEEMWRPVGDPAARRLINEIVVGEESDIVGGRVVSHFELYLEAMAEIGADASAVRRLIDSIERRTPVRVALVDADVPRSAREFVLTTMEVIERTRPHEIAAAFTLGREQAVPPMFRELVASIERSGVRVDRLRAYLDRHIQLDEDEHGPAALRLLEMLCADEAVKWHEAETAAVQALDARARLWSGIEDALAVPSKRTNTTSSHPSTFATEEGSGG